MSELLEFLLELLDVISGLPEGWSDTLAVRIFLGAILVVLGGLIWWELR